MCPLGYWWDISAALSLMQWCKSILLITLRILETGLNTWGKHTINKVSKAWKLGQWHIMITYFSCSCLYAAMVQISYPNSYLLYFKLYSFCINKTMIIIPFNTCNLHWGQLFRYLIQFLFFRWFKVIDNVLLLTNSWYLKKKKKNTFTLIKQIILIPKLCFWS